MFLNCKVTLTSGQSKVSISLLRRMNLATCLWWNHQPSGLTKPFCVLSTKVILIDSNRTLHVSHCYRPDEYTCTAVIKACGSRGKTQSAVKVRTNWRHFFNKCARQRMHQAHHVPRTYLWKFSCLKISTASRFVSAKRLKHLYWDMTFTQRASSYVKWIAR